MGESAGGRVYMDLSCWWLSVWSRGWCPRISWRLIRGTKTFSDPGVKSLEPIITPLFKKKGGTRSYIPLLCVHKVDTDTPPVLCTVFVN